MLRDPQAIIYSDSDGVICDFYAGAERLSGHPWSHAPAIYARQAALIEGNKLFWETLPPMPDWNVYWSYIERYQPHILTAVPSWDHHFADVEEGKRKWYRHHIPTLPQDRIHVVYRRDKAKYATRGPVRNILIDDHMQNIKEFEAAGGIGIHHVSAKVTILKLKELGYH